ncbi:non-structural maintenance of chromosomes element 1 homolog isoform X2 [Cyclopterus lumpus]|uniref:non-structural maintenance of chromosomes element 1 homolog isoform X2 n=1 Tax=Cyclopterus lumpus TaxID=8103 RepID=UPI001486A41E|nr:non-structural maintenance of chromosomes element 1 homolog isoform X2 [Cyclopterus lumpus]
MSRQMGDSHRRFLQTMMSNGIVDEQGARTLHQYCCETHNTQHAPDKLDDFIDAINSKLQPMFMQIRKGMSEDNGHQFYALVNMAETDVTRMSSDYADNELELFRKTMDQIVGSENGTASSTDILNSADTLTTKKLKKSETEHLLNRLVHDQWLSEMYYRDGAIHSYNVSGASQSVPHLSQYRLTDTSKEDQSHGVQLVMTFGHMKSLKSDDPSRPSPKDEVFSINVFLLKPVVLFLP